MLLKEKSSVEMQGLLGKLTEQEFSVRQLEAVNRFEYLFFQGRGREFKNLSKAKSIASGGLSGLSRKLQECRRAEMRRCHCTFPLLADFERECESSERKYFPKLRMFATTSSTSSLSNERYLFL